MAPGSVKEQNVKIRETDKGQAARGKASQGSRRTEVCSATLVALSRIVSSNIEYVIPAPGGRRAVALLKLIRLGIYHAAGGGLTDRLGQCGGQRACSPAGREVPLCHEGPLP